MEKENKAKRNAGNDISEEYYSKIAAGVCPECGEPLVNEGGCSHCPACGWAAC